MKQDLGPLGMIDLLTDRELKETLGHHFDSVVRDWVRGIKYIRLPLLAGFADGSGNLALGVSMTTNAPNQGYAWSVKRLAVSGLTAGVTPDVVNVFRGGDSNNPVWQLNGNNFAYTFGKLDLVLLAGENLFLTGASLASTSRITLTGDCIEVPQEMLGKLV